MHYFGALKIRLGELSGFFASPPKLPLAAATHELRPFFFFLKMEWVTAKIKGVHVFFNLLVQIQWQSPCFLAVITPK